MTWVRIGPRMIIWENIDRNNSIIYAPLEIALNSAQYGFVKAKETIPCFLVQSSEEKNANLMFFGTMRPRNKPWNAIFFGNCNILNDPGSHLAFIFPCCSIPVLTIHQHPQERLFSGYLIIHWTKNGRNKKFLSWVATKVVVENKGHPYRDLLTWPSNLSWLLSTVVIGVNLLYRPNNSNKFKKKKN